MINNKIIINTSDIDKNNKRIRNIYRYKKF